MGLPSLLIPDAGEAEDALNRHMCPPPAAHPTFPPFFLICRRSHTIVFLVIIAGYPPAFSFPPLSLSHTPPPPPLPHLLLLLPQRFSSSAGWVPVASTKPS
jgi:hypothetical protein